MPKGAVAGLADKLSDIRDQLLLDARALAGRRFIDGDRLKNCKMQPGYRPLASDVLTIVAVLKERWSTLVGKTPMTLAELNEAASKATDLLAAVGLKEQAPTTVGEAALIRQKAFGLFASSYEDARRAVLYLRAKEEDGDEIAPSIYGGRGRRGGAESSESATAGAPGTSGGSTTPQPTSGPAITINNPSNLPVTAPFVS